MASGLIALLDDVAAIAKVAAATLDDVAAQATKAGAKAAGVVIDDAAVTPRYVVGFASDRELPIVAKIARGSLKNKLLFLLPAALALSVAAPFAILPLLMAGGLFLCFEGYEKVHEMVLPHANHGVTEATAGLSPQDMEQQKVAGAIRTDFILSAEIMAISLAQVATASIWMQALVLGAVGIAITVAVYGAVALIVRADDMGVAMARSGNGLVAALGRGLVKGMPTFLKVLSVVGTLAMLWVGGGIVLHGAESYGLDGPSKLLHDVAHAVGVALPGTAGVIAEWLVSATGAAIVGIVLGALTVPLATYVVKPLMALVQGRRETEGHG